VEDGERVFGRSSRLDDTGNQRAVLIILPAANHPSRSSFDRFTHEYELKDELDEAWAVRPLGLVRDAGRTMLVLEDPGGEPLDRLRGAPMEVGFFLRLAMGIALALGKLHKRGLVHKANIFIDATTGAVRLTGFGIASRLARERQSPHPPETIAGTLAYMAPEQTGRMNRSIDSEWANGLGGKSDKKRCAQIWRDALRFFVDGDDHFGAVAGYEIESRGSPE
jgi:serine/threonine protein kinase